MRQKINYTFCWLASIVFLTTIGNLSAQIIPGSWRTHFSYNSTTQVAWAGNTIYAVSNGKLFSYEPETDEIKEHNTLTGLNGNTVSFIEYSQATKTLLIVYSDGNIDFIHNEEIYNLPDYKDKTLTANKTVRRIRMYGNKAFIATDACLLEVDMLRREITNTYYFRTQEGNYMAISDFAKYDSQWVLIADQKLYFGDPSLNLLDAHNWEEKAFLSWCNPEQIVSWNGALYASSDYLIFKINEWGNWPIVMSEDMKIQKMENQNDILCVQLSDGSYKLYTSEWNIVPLRQSSEPLSTEDLSFNATHKSLCTASDKSGIAIWDFNVTDSVFYNTTSGMRPNGPASNTAWKIYSNNDNIYTVSGGRFDDQYFWTGGINRFHDNNWESIIEDPDTIEAKTGQSFLDIINLAIDPQDDNHFYACSWGGGLYEFNDGNTINQYTGNNSPLKSVLPTSFRVRVDGATFDSDGNLWVVNSQETDQAGIRILKPDGTWLSPSYSNFPTYMPTAGDILFASDGNIWINCVRVIYGIFVIDPNNTLDDPSDDRTLWISTFHDQDGKTIDTWGIFCIKEDKDGVLWIGTTYGPILYYPTSTLFDQMPTFSRVKVPRNDGTNEADYLLSTSRIQSIAIDGANRKWLGTESDGVYLVSPDGIKTIHHFTKDNSPLPSNDVYSVLVNPNDGEVFIGTAEGLVSYRDHATEGTEDYNNVYAYPNPVPSGFSGVITITGLKTDSQVHITDLQGHLLAKGTSLGGQFVWDGCLPSGNRAASGVYPVFVADDEGNRGLVCKIVLIN